MSISPYTEEHEIFRASVRRFVEKRIMPHVADWDEAGEFPRSLYEEAAKAGLLAPGYPEEYGGAEVDLYYAIIVGEELARAASGGLCASLLSHGIGTPPILRHGSPELRRRVLPDILAGRKISALAITEPGGGSDVAQIRTTAVLQDDGYYLVNGEKTFITSGMRADYYTVAVRTGGPGAAGLSLLLIERDLAGFTRTLLKKMGWWMSDTATLHFEQVRVPAANLIGAEGDGFKAIMGNFNFERLHMAALANAFSRVCFDEALAWARMRHTFGMPLVERQVIRHKLADMRMQIVASEAFLEKASAQVVAGKTVPGDIALLKNFATNTMQFCADQAVQILGGTGFMRGTPVERIYREVKVMMIGGGSTEIMKDLAARQHGW